jgi:hypothetical protein
MSNKEIDKVIGFLMVVLGAALLVFGHEKVTAGVLMVFGFMLIRG